MTDNCERPKKVQKLHNAQRQTLNLPLKRQIYDQKFPNFQKPKLLGEFSVDENRDFHANRSQLKFFNENRFKNGEKNDFEKVQWDLNCGMDRTYRKTANAKTEKLDHMLRWILCHKNDLKSPGSSGNLESIPADFVCFRGLLTTLMTTPYENSNDWEVWAVKFRGTIYLYSNETKQKQERDSRSTERDAQMSSWGYKFEQYMQTDHPTSEKAQMKSSPDELSHEPVIENEEFCCVFRSRLGENSIIFGAEMDGFQMTKNVDNSTKIDVDKIDLSTDGYFVELKTSRLIENDRQFSTFCRFKTQKWWAQSFMVGIPKLICGFRDDDGLVLQLKEYPTGSLPKMTQDPFWLPNVCMNFLDKFLDCVKSTVNKDLCVFKFIWPLKSWNISVEEDSDAEIFLPEWYIKGVFAE